MMLSDEPGWLMILRGYVFGFMPVAHAVSAWQSRMPPISSSMVEDVLFALWLLWIAAIWALIPSELICLVRIRRQPERRRSFGCVSGHLVSLGSLWAMAWIADKLNLLR